MLGSENASHERSRVQKIWSPLMRFCSSSGPKKNDRCVVREGERFERYGRYSPVKANVLMRAQELSGKSAHGFPEGKAVVRPKAVLAAMHEPPRSHEPRIR